MKDRLGLQLYRKASYLRRDSLDDSLAAKVWPSFIRGEYEFAVFQAFKDVQVRVRDASRLGPDRIGVPLMREAFHTGDGPLTDSALLAAEQEAMAHLFAGSIGLFKNPSSHRDVLLDNPARAAELILLANHLLYVVDLRARSCP